MAWMQGRVGPLREARPVAPRELDLSDRDSDMPRLWRGFMAARILIAGVLLILLLYLRLIGQPPHSVAMLLCLAYLAFAVWVRVLGKPVLPGERLEPQWLITVGIDVIVFGLLLYLKVGAINFTPLFALPVLLAAVLGPLVFALGTAAAVTLALLFDALQYTWDVSAELTGRYIQAAITGTGLFVVAYLANQLSTRLIRQEIVAKGSEMAARLQVQVNQLVIDSLADGVLVVDAHGMVRATNPSAREMLGIDKDAAARSLASFILAGRVAWQGLAELAAQSIREQAELSCDVIVDDQQNSQRMLHVKTKLSIFAADPEQGSLCVMFMKDLREVEARIRTEKLAAMGRMSAAVAHEIRNPLSAISQANALLAEEIKEPQQVSLVRMVAQNVQRLSRVVDDVLDVARVEGRPRQSAVIHQPADFIQEVCKDWAMQNRAGRQLSVQMNATTSAIEFEADHLRRVLVNLLDNALRYASGQIGSIQVECEAPSSPQGQFLLSVWSDGAPIDMGVQRHLFEPFFSSQSRSSGLGLYICRELCIRHGASISYQRARRGKPEQTGLHEGNEFQVVMRASGHAAGAWAPALPSRSHDEAQALQSPP